MRPSRRSPTDRNVGDRQLFGRRAAWRGLEQRRVEQRRNTGLLHTAGTDLRIVHLLYQRPNAVAINNSQKKVAILGICSSYNCADRDQAKPLVLRLGTSDVADE